MLSQLSKGYGSWTAGYVDPYFGEKRERECTLPEIDQDSHFHGVTIGSRSGRSTAMSYTPSKRSREPTADGIPLPKTYTTRKGALQLFVGPDDLEDDDDDDNDDDNDGDQYPLKPKYIQIKRPHGQELIDLSLKLGTMERLAMSVLQYGDEDYDHDDTSVTDSKNKAVLKFLHSIDEASNKKRGLVDTHVQPGGDLKNYLNDLKQCAGSRFSNMYVSKSRESLELQAILRGLDNSGWPLSYNQDGTASEKSGTPGQFTRPVSRVSSRGPSPGVRVFRRRYFNNLWPSSTPRSTYQVLSAKKVAASIRSNSYLGRPSSRISVADDEVSEHDPGTTAPVAPTSVLLPSWTPTDSTDSYLIDTRDKFYVADEDGDSSEDGRKRRRFKERSFLTNNSQLYQGRNSRKGEGQRVSMEVKVSSKGDGDSIGQMSQIEEEFGDSSEAKKLINEVKGDVDSCSDISETWAVKVSHVKQINVSEDEGDYDKQERVSPIAAKSPDIDKDNVKVKVDLRPSSAHSGLSTLSSNSGGTASTRAMSIITIQNAKNASKHAHPPNFDKYNLKKRRGTYQYDPDKGLIRSSKDRRPSEPFIRARSNSSHSVEQYKNQNSQKRSNGVDSTPPLQHYDDFNKRLLEHTDDDVNQTNVPEVVIEQPSVVDEEPGDALPYRNADLQPTDHEDYDIDDLDECNEEIQQIEAQAEHSDSDSDSCMDEEVIKVILEGQKSNEDLIDQHQYDDTIADDNDENKDNDDECNVGTNQEEGKSTSSVINDDAIDIDGGKSVSEDLIGTEGTSSIHGDDVEGTEEQVNDTAVDEIFDENVSDVRSTKSGRKSQSRRSTTKSVLGLEDGGTSTDEYGLPVLDSDRLDNKDGDYNEENQAVNDEQTGFSGSTDSYSDILAANKLSEPDNISQSRGSSSPKLSRSSSAACSKSPPNNEVNVQDQDITVDNELVHDNPNSGDKTDSVNVDHIEDSNIEDAGIDEVAQLPTDNEDKEAVDSIDQIKSLEEEQDKTEEPQNDVVPNTRKLEIHVDLGTAESMNETNSEISESHKPSSEADVNTKPIKVDAVKNLTEPKSEPKSDVTKKPIVIDKKVEPTKSVTAKVERKQSIANATLKNDTKSEQNQKVTKPVKTATATKPIARTDTKSNIKTKPVASTNDKNKSKVSNRDASDKKDIKAVGETLGDSSRLEGEGLYSVDSKIVSRLDDDVGDGLYTTDDITGDKDAHSIAAELESLGLAKGKKGSKVYPLLPPGPRPKAPPEKQKIPDHLQDALNRRSSKSKQYLEEDLERMTAMVGETLSGPTLEAVGEGLTEEELELAKQLLQQKLDEAKGQLDGKSTSSKAKSKKTSGSKSSKKSKKKNDPSDDKTQEEMDRDAIRARHDHEKQLREQEAAELQRKIAENKRLLKLQADQTSAKSKELLDEMARLEREALDMQRAEDEARQILADERKKQREERETRRKADLERKKQEAMDRRERERKEMEEKRQKELKMMEQIADAEMRRRMREEEERRIDEEERLAQERYEAEMQEAQRQEEEEEERLKEMERQAEEEAMQRLIDEREAAERERRRLREEEEAFREAERLRMEQIAAEHRKLEEERQRLQDIEDAKREAERQNLLKLRQLEEEARLKMQEEIEKRRADALSRRDFNLENKQHVDKLRHYQGITRAWTFSYFVHWPRETYESRLRPKLQKGRRPMGMGDPRKAKINNPPPKKAEDAPPGGGEQAPAESAP